MRSKRSSEIEYNSSQRQRSWTREILLGGEDVHDAFVHGTHWADCFSVVPVVISFLRR
jgi:hypothetical protein